MSTPIVRMSVRAVVETTLHESDISPAAASAKRMREGTAAHRARQQAGASAERAYRAEQALSAVYQTPVLTLRVSGRADALLLREDGQTVVEEIKLGAEGAPLVPAHRAQAAMYGHMLCVRDALDGVVLRVLYVDVHGAQLAVYEEKQSAQMLAKTFDALCAPAAAWEEKKLLRRQARDASLTSLAFPFEQYRAGQRKFAGNVYVAIDSRKRLFAQAPTGIGKTMAAIYPALRAVGAGKCGRVLFLTARSTGRRAAMDALLRLRDSGAKLLAAEIAAKDKVCVQTVRDCRPEHCPRAAGFYDRLPNALAEAVASGGCFGRQAMDALAEKYALCPFELSLELAMLSDAVVCDYNYVYDPFVAIDRLLTGAALLVDEAHQLAPRVQDGLSAAVDVPTLTQLRREIGKAQGRKSPLYGALTEAIRALQTLGAQAEFARLDAPPQVLCEKMTRVLEAAGEALAQGAGKPAADCFLTAMAWQYAAEHFCERYAVLTDGDEKHAAVRLLLLCAAPEILAQSARARGTVYFSATLAPFDAAKRMLGSEEGDACLALKSPFSPEQLSVAVQPIDIRYAVREKTAPQVADAIAAHLRAHAGHTLIFFPSYAYMARIGELLLGEEGLADTVFLTEARGMREDEKNALLGAFEEESESRAALLCVLGGAFAEGIDLAGDRLKNVVVVSTGLPQPDQRISAMQRYYDAQGEDGFFLCMTLPGMVRVIQAAGRLIRTHTDTGSLLLIDSRFAAPRTRALFGGTLIGDAMDQNA